MNEIWQRGQTDPESMPDAVLFSRIADTIAWCHRILSRPETSPSLRTDEIKPRLLHDGCDYAICDVGSSRHWQVKLTNTKPCLDFPDMLGGKLMTYFPDADLCDGAAEIESEYFFDVFNCPPWDTWIGFFDEQLVNDSYGRYLLAYVPEQLVPLADAGINVNPEECILWLTATDVKMRSRLLNKLNA